MCVNNVWTVSHVLNEMSFGCTGACYSTIIQIFLLLLFRSRLLIKCKITVMITVHDSTIKFYEKIFFLKLPKKKGIVCQIHFSHPGFKSMFHELSRLLREFVYCFPPVAGDLLRGFPPSCIYKGWGRCYCDWKSWLFVEHFQVPWLKSIAQPQWQITTQSCLCL